MTTTKSNTTLYLTASALTIFAIANIGGLIFLGVKTLKKGWYIITSYFSEEAIRPLFSDYLNLGFVICGIVIVFYILNMTTDKIAITKVQIKSNNNAKVHIAENSFSLNSNNHSNSDHDASNEVVRNFTTEKLKPNDAVALDKMIGLHEVKSQVKKVEATLKYEKEYGGTIGKKKAHMVFIGNPGTGKTMVARSIAALFYNVGAIERPVFMDINAIDLMGKYIGSTGPTVERIFKLCKGGVLFIDEAYALVQSCVGGYANEAVNALLTQLENNKYDVTVIFAGYREEINELMAMNPGLKSRIQHTVEFPDYSPEELVDIAELNLKRLNHKLPEELKPILFNLFTQKIGFCRFNKLPFSNGRYARNVAESIHTAHSVNYMDNPNIGTSIVEDDINHEELFRLS